MVTDPSEESGSNTDVDLEEGGKYHVLMELGRGGTAVVSAGIARGIGGFTKLVVLKTIKEEFLGDRDTVGMFVNEARLSARMNHPNVVQVYEVFRRKRLPVIVMEYLDGQSLARIQTRGFNEPAYTTAMGITILCKVLSGLEYAHSLADYDGRPLGLVHRDVSPHNVMLTYDGQVKLVDFGIAKLNSTSHQTKTGVVKGKIAYMAPEQLEGAELDRRGDLFSVGVMMWEMLARRRMWGTRSDPEIVRSLVLDDVPSLRAAVPGIDPELARICEKALATDPEARYARAAELQADLENYLLERGLGVRQQDLADLVTNICADLRDQSAEVLRSQLAKFAAGTPSWKDALTAFEDMRTPVPPRRSRGRWWLLGVCALIALATAALLFRSRLLPSDPALAQSAERQPESARGPMPKPPEPSAASERVSLRINVSPRSALITLDGRPLSSSPLVLSLPRDSIEHELRAQAEGFHPLTQPVRLDADRELTLELVPLQNAAPIPDDGPPPEPPTQDPREASAEPAKPAGGARPKPAEGPGAKRRPVRPAPSPKAPPERAETSRAEAPEAPKPPVDCDPPYFIGPDGLKHYRRECL